jgi:hypothetical protein
MDMREDNGMAETDMSTDPAELQNQIEFWKSKSEKYKLVLQAFGVFERSYVLGSATMSQRQRYHQLAKFVMAGEFESRRQLGEQFLREASLDPSTASLEIPKEDGVASVDLSGNDLVRKTVSEALAFYEAAVAAGRKFPSKDSLEFVGSANKDFDETSALFALASSPLVLAPVTRYFGLFPILTGFGITLARNEAFHRKSSQRLHFDPEDRSQLKAFVYLTDVDTMSGPFMAAPAGKSRHLFEQHDFILDRKDDDVVEPGSIREFHGPAGTMIFCDTCRCLHAGARPGARQRLMLSIEYNLPSHLGRRLFPKDNEPGRVRTNAIKLGEPDIYQKALLDIEG